MQQKKYSYRDSFWSLKQKGYENFKGATTQNSLCSMSLCVIWTQYLSLSKCQTNQLLLHSAKCILLITKKDKGALSKTLCLQDGNILIELQVTLGRTKKLTSSYLVMAQTCPRPTCSHNLLNACKSSYLCEMSFLLVKMYVG